MPPAADLEALGEEVRRRVARATGVTLEWEICRVGRHPPESRRPGAVGRGAQRRGRGMTRHVAVLMGGWSAEREVSLRTGANVVGALETLGLEVTAIDVDLDIATVLAELKPDVAFNALHGRFGEDGCMQGVLETLRIPYTHSGVLASALAMHKPTAIRAFADAGLPCPDSRVVSRTEYCRAASPIVALPHVVKPLNEGSSVGVRIVKEGDNVDPGDIEAWAYGDYAVVEQYVPGREITVAVLDDEPLDALEIRPRYGFYDYEAKYTEGGFGAPGPGADPSRLLRAGPGHGGNRPPHARLPRRHPGRPALRRQRRRARAAVRP